MAGTAIVCDSTCDLGLEWMAKNKVTMVPLKVHFGEETFLDWVDLQPAEFYKRLVAAPALPTTSQPTPGDFSKAYASLAEEGYDEIVSIHLTSALSGTFESAMMAAKDSPIPVRVVDTKIVSQAIALIVKAAVRARDEGLDGAAVEQVALQATTETRFLFILDTLEYLVKGGRAGKASGLAAAVLKIKPVLTFNDDGIIEPFKKVKGTRKAIAEVAAQAALDSESGRLRLIIFTASDSQDIADQMRSALDEAGVDYEFDSFGLVGSVIGTYAGPRSVGVAYHPVG